MTSTAEPLNDHASSAKNEVLRAEQRPVGAGRLRLDALTIAGLTGTPHNGGDTARFFGTAAEGASASPRSPAAGSDDTLCSIQDSSVAEEDKDGDGSSVLSDELGEIAFTDDEHGSGSEDAEGDDGGGDATSTIGGGDGEGEGGDSFTVLSSGLEKVWGEEACRDGGTTAGELETEGGVQQGGAAPALATAKAEGDKGLDLAATSRSRPDSRTAVVPRPAATAAPATACGVARSCGGDMFAGMGGDDGAPAHSVDDSSILVPPRPASQASPPGVEGEQRQRCTPHSSGGDAKAKQRQQQQRPQQPDTNRGSDGRVTEPVAGGSSANDVTSSDSGITRSHAVVSPSIPAADAASCSTVSGADSGGGGVSSTLQAVPPGTVPTVTCKVLVVGNAKCGKSSIISRFVSNRFSSDYRSTVGADYAMKDVCLQGGRQVRLQLWDIAGQDRFAKLTRAYFRRAKGAVVVCDVTREGTFDAIVRWKEEIDLWCQNEGCELPVYLFANKCDLLTEVQDSFLAGARMEKTCRDSGFAGWYITSAKRGDNINTAMTNLLDHALKAEDQRNRGMERGRSGNHGNGGANGDDGGGPKGEAFQLSSRGRREGEGLEGQQGACCA